MTEHITDWLGAYRDGELPEARRLQVEAHLQACPDCQAELQTWRNLGRLLQQAPAPDAFPPADRFAAQLALRLPRRRPALEPRAVLVASWWALPMVFLVVWVFIQTVFGLSTLVEVAGRAGWLGETAGWLTPTAAAGPAWLTEGAGQLGLWVDAASWNWARQIEALAWMMVSHWIWQIGLAGLCLGWLVLGLAYRQHQAGQLG